MADSTPLFRSTDALTAAQASELVRLTQNNQLRNVLLGKLASADMNSAADQAIAINLPTNGKYVIRNIVVTNASISLTTAVGGIYAAASKTTPIVANSQAYTTLTASTKVMDLVVLVSADIRSEATLYLSLTTAQGAAATADIYVFGDIIL